MIRWTIGVALLFGILLLMLPKTDQESLTKLGSASMLMCTSRFRDEIARQLANNALVIAAEFKNTCPDLVSDVELRERGRVVITGNKYKVKMTLTPVVEGGQVRWSCRGEPAKAVTKLCSP